jgi:hypothetical protein
MANALRHFIENPKDTTVTQVRTTKFILQNLNHAASLKNKKDLMRYSINQVKIDGLYLEFGVYKGESLNYIASLVENKTVYGFDSFEGMPEEWITVPIGRFKLDKLPKVRSNARLVVGWFQKSLIPFLEEHDENVAFINLDAVLYSSTSYVLFTLAEKGRLQRGTVIQFDEIFNYLGWWEGGEYKALQDFVDKFDVKISYIGYQAPSIGVPTKGGSALPLSIKILKI